MLPRLQPLSNFVIVIVVFVFVLGTVPIEKQYTDALNNRQPQVCISDLQLFIFLHRHTVQEKTI